MSADEPDPGPEGLFDASLQGTVSRVVYSRPDGAWAVVRLELDDGSEATVVGELGTVHEGEALEVAGSWVDDPRFGRQLRAERARAVRPASPEAIRRYLESGVVPGIGPELAQRLVEEFGAGTLEVMDREPQRLLEVRGIGEKRLAAIREHWQEQAAERSARIFLQEMGLGPALTERILEAWGVEAEDRIRADPYRLSSSDEIPGIGFKRADAVARRLPDFAADTEARARAGVRHVLEEQAGRGHCYVPYANLVRQATQLLELDDDQIVRRAVDALLEAGDLRAEKLLADEARRLGLVATPEEGVPRAVWLAAFQGAESRVARRLARVAATAAAERMPGALAGDRARRAVAWVEEQRGIELGGDQRRALEAALSEKVLLVTGGPGTGKTTLIDAVVRCADALGAQVELAAPTGRAAKRLAEATGHGARTIHRLLEYRPDPHGFARNARHPLEADLLVIDEASMVDIFLMDALVAAIPPEAGVLLVGDADQLPPVGPGAVLRDLLESAALPVVRLTEIYRQARRSLIVRNAHRVNAGRMPEGLEGPGSWEDPDRRDFFFIEADHGERARELVLHLVTRRIPARFGLDPRRDVQVVSPMHRGAAGVSRLNEALQRALNRDGPGFRRGDAVLRPGDRVIQHRNDYDRDVFNGDIGTVVSVSVGAGERASGGGKRDGAGVTHASAGARGGAGASMEEGREPPLVVEFDGRDVGYDVDAARDLGLAYAITIHKSQGSEYPAVVTVLLPEHHVMLQRNLLYTALTRARRLAVLVGSRRAVGRAVRNAAPMERCTRLAWRLGRARQEIPDAGSGGEPGRDG